MWVDTDLTRTHTQQDARRRKNLLRQVPLLLQQLLLFFAFLQIAFLQDRRLKEKVNIPAQCHQTTKYLQARNRLFGVFTNDLASRERPERILQKPKEPNSAMLKIHSRVRNPAELLKLQLKHYHIQTPNVQLASARRHA